MKKLLLPLLFAITTTIMSMGQWVTEESPFLNYWNVDDANWRDEMIMAPNGNTWIAAYFPFGLIEEINGVKDTTLCTGVAVQLIDTAGNLLFEKPMHVSLQRSSSMIEVTTLLYVDRDGNAIIGMADNRYDVNRLEHESFSVYKISQEGEMLWGKNGITLDGENVYELTMGLSMVQITDGSYIFAWTHGGYRTPLSISMQRISEDGEMLWTEERITLTDPKGRDNYQLPTLVDGGNNQAIMVYYKGSSRDIYARMIDFTGQSVWSEDTRIYNGGWGSIPPHTLVDIKPSGNNGVLVSWCDDRFNVGIESPHLAYVKNNGDLGFYEENGVKLGYADWRSFDANCLYDPATDDFYVMWNESDEPQAWYRMVAQRIDKESGELLWGENGLELEPMERTNYGFNSLQTGADGNIAFFYMRSYSTSFGNVEGIATLVNAEDTLQRVTKQITKIEGVETEKSRLESTAMYDNRFWVVKWVDSGALGDPDKEERYFAQRVNSDLTLGCNANNAIESVCTDDMQFAVLSTIVDGMTYFTVNVPEATPATLSIYDVNGRLVAQPFKGVIDAGKQYIEWQASVASGLYIATFTTTTQNKSVKVLVK